MMKKRELAQGIFSEARFRVLRVLWLAAEPVSLREIAYRTGCGLSSVQAAVKSLLRLEYLERTEVSSRVYFERNVNHSDWPALDLLFGELERREIGQSAHRVSPAQDVMEALDDLWVFGKKIKRAEHASK